MMDSWLIFQRHLGLSYQEPSHDQAATGKGGMKIESFAEWIARMKRISGADKDPDKIWELAQAMLDDAELTACLEQLDKDPAAAN